jgi:hypothetical protein
VVALLRRPKALPLPRIIETIQKQKGAAMTRQITLTISEHTYQRAQRLAQLRKKEVADVLADYLADTLLPNDEQLFPQIDPDPVVEQERMAYLALHDELWRKYPHEYVAIYKGHLIDHDTDKQALFERIDENYPDHFVLIRQVEQIPEKVYQFHSTRFAY